MLITRNLGLGKPRRQECEQPLGSAAAAAAAEAWFITAVRVCLTCWELRTQLKAELAVVQGPRWWGNSGFLQRPGGGWGVPG